MSISYRKALKIGDAKHGNELIFSGASQLNTEFEVDAVSVPENFFDVVNPDYYVQQDAMEDVPGIDKLPNGDMNPI